MTQKELRNLLVQELYAYLGGPKVVLSDQVMPEAEYPYLYYQSIQQHIPGPANLFNEGAARRPRRPSASPPAAWTGTDRTGIASVGTMKRWSWRTGPRASSCSPGSAAWPPRAW